MEATSEETVVTLSITQDDIDHGEEEVCDKCPIALAGQRAVPTATRVSVGSLYINFYFPEAPNGVDRELPPHAVKFISNFDDGARTQPFSFPVSLPTRLLAPRGAL